VDGGLGFNNPVQELVNEAYFLYGAKRPIGCIVSIGTGLGRDVSLGPISVVGVKRWVRGIVSVASGSERQHERMIANSLRLPPVGEKKYFRFNVGETDWAKGVNENEVGVLNNLCGTTVDMLEEDHFKARYIQLDDCERMQEFAELSKRYMTGKDQQKLARKCAKRLYRTALTPTGLLIRARTGPSDCRELGGEDQGAARVFGSGQLADKMNEASVLTHELSSQAMYNSDYASLNLSITSSHGFLSEDNKKHPTKASAVFKRVKFYSFEWKAREAAGHGDLSPHTFRQLLIHFVKREWVPSWMKINSREFRGTFRIMIFFVTIIVLIKLLITPTINDADGIHTLPIMIRNYSNEKASVGVRSLAQI